MKNSKWENYDAYLQSPEWAKIRGTALDRAKNRCQVCNSPHDLHAHHRVYDCRWGEESTDDLTILCNPCHMLFHRHETDIRAIGKLKKKIENLQRETQRTTQKKAKQKAKQDPHYAKVMALSPPPRRLPEPDIKAYEQQALAAMQRAKKGG